MSVVLDNCLSGTLSATVEVVISNKKDAKGLETSQKKGVPSVHIDPNHFASKGAYEREIVKVLQEHQVDLVVLAGYMRIVGSELLSAYASKMINIHPSLLPAFPGLHAQKQALDYGVKYSGCTVHYVDEGVDSGPIIMQAVVPVLADDTEASLSARILEEEHQLLTAAIEQISQGNIKLSGRKTTLRT